VGGLTAPAFPGLQSPGLPYEFPFSSLPSAGVFRFGRLTASVRSNDAVFSHRFLRIFQDCRVPGPGSQGSNELAVYVPEDGSDVVARISGHGKLDSSAVQALLPGIEVRAEDDRLIVPKSAAWQVFLAHYFVHDLLARQQDLFFLHGATVAVGQYGLFIGGEKGAGKSTLSLALGARGHAILGDEVAAIAGEDLECLPFRRAVSIREGLQAGVVQARIARGETEVETLPDGTTRRRIAITDLFPQSEPAAVRLEAAVFLSGFGERCSIEPFDFSPWHAHRVGPLLSTFSSRPAGLAAIGLMRLFSRVRCYKVTIAGNPDDMAAELEAIAEGGWDTTCSNGRNASERFDGSPSG